MSTVERKVEYFIDPGSQNTEEVIDSVKRRITNGDISKVVVASTSGETGVKFARELKGSAMVIAVSHEEMNADYRHQITKHGGKALDKTHLALHAKGMDDVRKTFYTFGQG